MKTKESQNQIQIEEYENRGGVTLGPWSSWLWRTDPKHLSFNLARYKFCAKMLQGKRACLEIGCGDAFGTPLLLESADTITAVDIEPLVIEDARQRFHKEGLERITFSVYDLTQESVTGQFDAAYSLDVIEHIVPKNEDAFMQHICASLKDDAVGIFGTPNVAAQCHASPGSRQGHVNLKSADTLRELMRRYFQNVLIFSMNDEVVHTGFNPMAHYLIGLGAGLKFRQGEEPVC
jgi:2-polyprenyl-3-methyl-5-hydroxy-6-metoxy-1,4-benzoquinol methylase